MKISTEQEIIINEITTFIKTSTDTDNLILSAFVAGLQARHNQESLKVTNIKSHD